MRQDVSRLAPMRVRRVAILASFRDCVTRVYPARRVGARDFKMSGMPLARPDR